MKKAIVFGGTGLIGENLLAELAHGFYQKVYIVVRSLSPKVKKLVDAHPNLFQVKEIKDLSDYSSALFTNNELVELSGCDIFCALGTTIKKAKSQENFKHIDFDLVLHVLKVTKELGADNLELISSAGADPDSKIFYSKIKGMLEREVIKLNFKYYYFLRPSLLLGDRSEFRLGELVMRELSFLYSPLMIAGLKKYRPIHAKVVAKAMLKLMHGIHEGRCHKSGAIENLEIQTMCE